MVGCGRTVFRICSNHRQVLGFGPAFWRDYGRSPLTGIRVPSDVGRGWRRTSYRPTFVGPNFGGKR